MNPKEFFKRWKQGMKELTMQQQLKAKINGHLGAMIGLSIALVALIYRTITNFNYIQLGFSIFVFFIIWLQRVEYIGTKQKLKVINEMLEPKESGELDKALGNVK